MTVISKFTYSAIAKALKKRYYTRLNGASWLQFAPVAILTGESVDGYFKVENDGYLLYGDDYVSVASGVITLSVNLTGTINGNVITSGVTTVTGGTDYFVFTATADTSFSYIGYSASPFVGTPYDVKFADKRNYKLSENGSETNWIYEDSANADGEELFDSDTVTLGSQWVDNGDGSYTYTGDGTYNALTYLTYSTAPEYILLSFDVTEISGDIGYTSGGYTPISEIGSYEFLIKKSDINAYTFKRNRSVASCTISNISIKQTTKAQGINITSDDVTQELA